MNKFKGRPTRDIDFLAEHISNELKNIENAFRVICNIECDDGISYNLDELSVERIKEDADYEGVRIKIISFLGKANEKIQIDIGFGDIVVPDPVEMEYPTLLEVKTPKVMVYSTESIIAEKFQAMVALSVFNSRMKDFYDIYNIALNENIKFNIVREAIDKTFNKRETDIRKYVEIFKSEFIKDEYRNSQWKTFLKKINSPVKVEYEIIMQVIEKFLIPVVKSIIDGTGKELSWDNEKLEWK